MSGYDLYEKNVQDGALTGRRSVLLEVKVMTSMTIALVLLTIGLPPLDAGLIASAGLMAYIAVEQVRFWRTKRWLFVVDKLNDFALSGVALACCVKLAYGWTLGLAVLIACSLIWAFTHTRSDP